MKQRWYDSDPTISMAISLLQNASHVHQEMAANYMFKLMEAKGLLDVELLRTKSNRISFIFPSFRRSSFEMHARHLVEVMKHLPAYGRQEMAVHLINYIYILDSGMSDLPISMEEIEEFPARRPESG